MLVVSGLIKMSFWVQENGQLRFKGDFWKGNSPTDFCKWTKNAIINSGRVKFP